MVPRLGDQLDLIANLSELLEPVIAVVWNVNPETQERTRFIVTLLTGVASLTTLVASLYGFFRWWRGRPVRESRASVSPETRRAALELRRQGRQQLAQREYQTAIGSLTRALELTP